MKQLLVPALLALLPLAAAAQDPLQELVPLIEVFDSRHETPGFDVAGIRCAGMYAAQIEWARRNPGARRPSAAQIQDIEDNLARAEQHRLRAGLDIVAAYETTRTDVLRVVDLYLAHFNSRGPNDRLMQNDGWYCDVISGRQ